MLRFAPGRSIPQLYKTTLRAWVKKNARSVGTNREVYLFADEFTNYLDVRVGICFVELLQKLGYTVVIPEHVESGRTEISKGLLKKAARLARKMSDF